MSKSTKKVVPKKRRGRPATGRDPVRQLRMSEQQAGAVTAWAKRRPDKPNWSEAVRTMLAEHTAWQPLIDYLRECAKNEPKTAEERQQRNNRALELQNQAFEAMKRLGLA